MSDRPITDSDWKEYEISGRVDDDAENLVFGCFLLGSGTVWIDAWRLDVQTADGKWEAQKLTNPDFDVSGHG